MTDFQRLLSAQNFQSPQEAEAFMKNMVGKKIPEFENEALSLEEQAEDIVFAALECEDDEQRIHLLVEALSTDPNCIMAYEQLGHEQAIPHLALPYFSYGIELGKQKFLTKDYLKENKGHFYGLHETRPFLRCMLHYANSLCYFSFNEKALPIYKSILELNKNDNMGVRYRYAALLLEDDLLEEFLKIDKHFEEEENAFACFNRALYLFKLKGDCAESKAALKKAIGLNKHIVPLLKELNPPEDLPDNYSYGSKEEALSYAEFAFFAWNKDEEVVEWLKKNKKKS